jgi:hypothetical protein
MTSCGGWAKEQTSHFNETKENVYPTAAGISAAYALKGQKNNELRIDFSTRGMASRLQTATYSPAVPREPGKSNPLEGDNMKNTYVKPNLKELGLLRVVTKFSCGPTISEHNAPTSDVIFFKNDCR